MAHPIGRRENLETENIGDEMVIHDLAKEVAHCLHPITARVWELADGLRSVPGIVVQLSLEGFENVDEELVWLALEDLADADLLTQRVSLPGARHRIGRHQMLWDLPARSPAGRPGVT